MPPALRVTVVDDSTALRTLVVGYLSAEDGVEVLEQHASAAAALAAVVLHRPDVLVLDDQMPGGDGIDALPALRAACPGTRIVMFSAGGPDVADLAAERGADAFVSKEGPLTGLVAAVRGGA